MPRALGRDDLGQLAAGKKADVVLIKNDHSPVSFPLLNPYGHVAFQAQRGDVHTVVVDGHVVKHEGRLVGADLPAIRTAVESTVDFLVSTIGEEAWKGGMNPDLPSDGVLDNPYQYTDYKSDATREARGTMFGDPGSELLEWRVADTDPTSSRRSRAGSTSFAALGSTDGALTLAEVAGAADLARPTARRLLLTLEELGYVRVGDGTYQPHARGCSRSGWRTSARRDSGTSPARTWRTSSSRTGESSSMAQLDGSDIVYVARVSVPKIIALRVEIGTRVPGGADLAGEGAAGGAAARPGRADAGRSPARPACRRTSAAAWSSCHDELAQVRARGWALADEELAPGVRSVAVPVRDGTGAVRAAMNVTVHAAETSVDTLLDDHLPHLLRAAGEVSADWALWQSRPHVEKENASWSTPVSGRPG